MLKRKTDVGTKFQKVGEEVQNAMSIFTSTVAKLRSSNEQLVQIDNEIVEEVTRLSDVQNGVKKQKEENDRVIEKIGALLGE